MAGEAMPSERVAGASTDAVRGFFAFVAAVESDGGGARFGQGVRDAVAYHRSLERRADAEGWWFDGDAIERFRRFAMMLCHYKGAYAGEPFVLEPWQLFAVGVVLGWKRDGSDGHVRDGEDLRGRRLITRAYFEVARKNGKTLLMAAIALYGMMLDGEAAAENYVAATKRDQARLAWNDAAMAARKSPHVRGRVKITESQNVIDLVDADGRATGGFIRALAADANKADGLNPHYAIVDELHAHANASMVNVLRSGFGARTQPVLWMITTGGAGRFGACWNEREYGLGVVRGDVRDTSAFALVFALDDDDDPMDEATWQKANPNLGVSVSMEDLRSSARRAEGDLEARQEFLAKRLNAWPDDVQSFVDMTRWRAAPQRRHPVMAERTLSSTKRDMPAPAIAELLGHVRGRPAYVGVDLSSTQDLTAVAVFLPWDEEDERLPDGANAAGGDAVVASFLPREIAEARARGDREGTGGQVDHAPYLRWAEEGQLVLTPGDVIDYAAVRAWVVRLREDHGADVRMIGVDPHNATNLGLQWRDEDGFCVQQVRQTTPSLSEPMKTLEAMVAARTIEHFDNPLLAWSAANLRAKSDDRGNIKPVKPGYVAMRSTGRGQKYLAEKAKRIDPMVALVNAIKAWQAAQADETGPSVYEERGVVFLGDADGEA